MKNPNLGDYLLWKGKLAKVISETWQRTVCLELLENKDQFDVIPTSPLFQENAQPVSSMDGDGKCVFIVREKRGGVIFGCFDSLAKAEKYADYSDEFKIETLAVS